MPTDRPEDQFKVPDTAEGLVAWLDKRYDRGVRSRPDLQPKINLAFTGGQHWAVWDPYRRELRRSTDNPAAPRAPIRITVNKIASHVEWGIARITRSAPQPECRPVSDDDEDLSTAKVGTRILLSEMNRLQFDQLLVQLYTWVVPVGWAYLQITWDPARGPVVGTVEETVTQVPSNSTTNIAKVFRRSAEQEPVTLTTTNDVHQGEVVVEVVPHFEFVADPSARTLEDARWCVRSIALSKEEIYERWGKVPNNAQPARTIATELQRLTEPMQSKDIPDTFLVKEFWMRPGSRMRPEGMRAVWCGKTLLEEPTDFPYDHGRLPFVQFNLLPGQGRREGRTWVDDLVPMQTDYNDGRSREAEIRRVVVPKLLYPRNSINPNKITTRVEMIDYAQTGPPPSFHIPDGSWTMPFEKTMDRCDKEMSERSSIAPSTRGELLSGMSAAALLAAQEAADLPGNISTKERDKAVAATGWQILMLTRQFWEEERTVRTWSDDGGKLEVDRFTKADIAGQLDVHVTSESALPRSKAARVQIAMELKQSGVIADNATLLRYMDIPGTDFLIKEIDLDVRQAEREQERLLEGEPVEVEMWHNHVVHSAVHNKLRKTEEYEQLPPEVKAVIDAHVDIHDSLIPGQIQAPGPPGTPGAFPTTNPDMAPEAQPRGTPPNPEDELAAMLKLQGPGRPGEVPGISNDVLGAAIGD